MYALALHETEANRKKRLAIVGMVAGGALLILGAVVYRRASRRPGSLGRVQSHVRAGDMTLTHHYDPKMPIERRVGILQDLVWKGVQNPQMRNLALAITGYGEREVEVGKRKFRVRGKGCPPRDGLCETRAIYDWIKDNIRYTGDVAPVKMGAKGPVEGVDLFQGAWRTAEFGGGDCLPAGTLLLTDKHEFVPIEKLLVGSRIWGRDAWTTVKDVWFKGMLPVDVVFLNNGSSFKATADHKLYVGLCKHHPVRWQNGRVCSCPMSERSIERVKLAQAEPGMVVVTPDRIAFGTESDDPDRATVEGLYLSDGWCEDGRFAISGQDGCPKEDQKHLVKAICDRLGVSTYWSDKYIRINDADWARRVARMGHRAPEKHALSISLDEPTAAALLRGIMADSGMNHSGNGRTFTTTSRQLMLQTRILHKMFGVACSERYIVDHGGLGKNPVWRLGVRDYDRSDGKAVKLLRIKAIERNVMTLPVYDLTTEDHYVYLPEADVTVSNCDDHSVLAATLLSLNGIPARFRVTAPTRSSDWAHIYALAGLPKTHPKKWVAIDTTLPGDMFGREARSAKHVDFVA